MMSDVEIKSVDQLMRAGMAAAQAQDFEQARAYFADALAQDSQNEVGWLWLASVVESAADKRECFATVLTINPNNATAQRELKKLGATPIVSQPALEAPIATPAAPVNELPLHATSIEVLGPDETAETAEVKPDSALKKLFAPFMEIPVSTRRQLIVVLIVLIVGVFALIITRGGTGNPPPDKVASAAAIPQNGSQPIAAAVQDNGTLTATPVPPTATDVLITQQSVIATLVPASLPPTWTPAATITPMVAATITPLAGPPPSLPGALAILSSTIISQNNFWPVIITAPDGSHVQQALADPNRAEFVQLVPDGKQMIFTYATEGTNSHLLQVAFRNGASARAIADAWGNQPALDNPHGDSLSADGHLLAFAAQDVFGKEQYPAIFVVNLTAFLGLSTAVVPTTAPTTGSPTAHAPPGVLIGTNTPGPTAVLTATTTPSLSTQYLTHVTPLNNGIDDWPSIAPSNQFVAFTIDSTNSGDAAIDLYVALIQPSSSALRLTKDGGTLVKSAPNWSPDSKLIAFTSTPKDNSYSDIEVVNADGSNRQVLVHLDKTHNFRPHWSPDGKYIGFTSDRSGHDQVYIMDVASKQVYQVTSDQSTNILSDWAAQ